MNTSSKKKAFFLYLLAALTLSLPFISGPLVNPDLFWHLSAGKFILENRAVPRADFLSWTMNGAPWTDFEWLTQAFYHLVYSRWDFPGLYFLKVALAAANLAVIGLMTRLSGLPSPHLLWLLPLSAAALTVSSDIRPENFSLLFFTLTFYFLEKTRTEGTGRRSGLFVFLVLYAFWANLHGGFSYGLALISVYAAGEFLNENADSLTGRGGKISFSGTRPFLSLLAAALPATLLNPYGFRVYSVIFEHLGQSLLLKRHISEWHGLNLSAWNTLPFVALLFLGTAALFNSCKRTEKADFTKILLALLFAWLCLNHMRQIAYGTAVFGFLLYSSLGEKLRLPRAAFAAAAAVLLLLGLHSGSSIRARYADFRFCSFRDSSEGLTSFLKKHVSELGALKMSNIWEWGGWLGWKLHPDYPVFVDGRYIFHSFLPELSASRKYLDSWLESAQRNDFELVIRDPGLKEIKFKNGEGAGETAAAGVFLPAEKWALVYFDSRIFAAVRRDSVSPEWLRDNEYRYLRPWGYGNLLSKPLPYESGKEKAEKEIARYLGEHGKDFRDPQLESITEWNKRKGDIRWEGGK